MKTLSNSLDTGLKQQVMKFEDTFSAETAVLQHFFPNTFKIVDGKLVRIQG